MNGFEALELMRKGERVRNGDKIYFLSDGKICFDSGSVKEIKCIFDFNGVYDLYEETYTGLEAIGLMLKGRQIKDDDEVTFKTKDGAVVWYCEREDSWKSEDLFDLTQRYRISK